VTLFRNGSPEGSHQRSHAISSRLLVNGLANPRDRFCSYLLLAKNIKSHLSPLVLFRT
jgi:hypothetical protein